jgi:hypothetical protein
MDVTECAFCQLPHPRERLRRDYELDICDACANGHAEGSLTERGHDIAMRRWETQHRTKNGTVTVYHFEITAHAPGDFAVTATFTRENFLDKLVKLFRREIQVGDPLFDDFVYIRTQDRVQTAALLQHSGAQSTLMALVSSFDRVEFVDGTFTMTRRSDGYIDFDAADTLAVCAMLVHIERTHLRQS